MPLRPDAPVFVPPPTAAAPLPNNNNRGPEQQGSGHGPSSMLNVKNEKGKEKQFRKKNKSKAVIHKEPILATNSENDPSSESSSRALHQQKAHPNGNKKGGKGRSYKHFQTSKQSVSKDSTGNNNINKPRPRQDHEHDNNQTSASSRDKQRRKGRRDKQQRQQERAEKQAGSVHPYDLKEEPEQILEPHSFPALGGNDMIGSSIISNEEELQQSVKPHASHAAWANVAKSHQSAELDMTNDAPSAAQDEMELLSSSSAMAGLKLTLLKKDRPSQRRESDGTTCKAAKFPNDHLPEPLNLTADDISVASEANDNSISVYGDRNEGNNGVNGTANEDCSFLFHRPPIRLGPKLRNRWWSVLQKSAQNKRQNRRLHLEETTQEEENKQQRKAATPLCPEVPQCQEYVELRPPAHKSVESDDEYQIFDELAVGIDELSSYISCAQPLHKAILNHDERGLESLLQLYRSDQLDSPTTQQAINHSIADQFAQWSPLQLAVWLDKPGLLRILLRAVAAEEDQIRRQARIQLEQRSPRLSTLVNNAHDGRCTEFPTALMMAAELGHEECAQLLLSHSTTPPATMVACKDATGNNSLHYCCRTFSNNLESATHQISTPSLLRSLLQVVTNAGGTIPSKVLSSKNNLGQTPLHVACQEGRSDMVEVFLDVCSGSSFFSVLIKLFAMKDFEGQTPLLAAIASGSTDLVMTLLMWRGNHHHHHLGTQQRQKASQMSTASLKTKDASSCCPLLWAVQTSGSADMVRLLLEFHDPSSLSQVGVAGDEEGYDLTHALHEAVKESASLRHRESEEVNDNDKLEIIRVLVEAGANPCSARQKECEDSLSEKSMASIRPTSVKLSKKVNSVVNTESSSSKTHNTSAIKLAARMGNALTLGTLLDSLRVRMQAVRKARRRDPTLRRQPESFFKGLESLEKGEAKSALSDGLATSLFLSYREESGVEQDFVDSSSSDRRSSPCITFATTDEYLACSLLLYRKGAFLGSNGLARLKCSLGTSCLKRVEDVITNISTSSPCGCDWHFNFRTGYHRENVSIAVDNGAHVLSMQERSILMQQMPWMKELAWEVGRSYDYCLWLSDQSERANDIHNELNYVAARGLKSDLVVLVTDCGATRLLAHGSIIAQQSAKLAAAVRFAKMSREGIEHSSDEMLEIDLGSTSSKSCVMLLQHLYHGSLVSGLPSNGNECCQELLELLLISQEFLCPTLAQEIEMRLLSANPYQCFCWSCCRATTALATRGTRAGYQANTDECIYMVEGPSRLVTVETVLDVLAVSQNLGDSCLSASSDDDDAAYNLEFAVVLHGGSQLSKASSRIRPSEGTSSEWTRLSSGKPFGGVRDVAVNLLLKSFSEVLDSPVYAARVEENLSEMGGNEADQLQYQDEAPALLLQMCLEELASSPTKEAFSVHSQSLKHVWAMFSSTNKQTSEGG